MARVFIDTNAFLGFYAYSSDDLAQLEKLVAEVKSGNIKLLITEQILDEFNRNRETKIAETLRKFTEKGGIDNFPRLIQHYAEYPALKKTTEEHASLKKQIMDQLRKDVTSRTLPADKIFDEIVGATTVLAATPEIIGAAQYRMAVGNPPGKHNSLGDALNWELLLGDSKPPSDLYLVTQDKDYISPIDSARVNDFLSDEWGGKCDGSVHLFPNLRELFKMVAPEIKLSAATASASANAVVTGVSPTSDEIDEWERAVQLLENSPSFARTHKVIASFPEIWALSKNQFARLFRASVENQQIAWIYEDDDVAAFFKALYELAKEYLPADVADKFKELYL